MSTEASALQLKIRLLEVSPMIWRQVAVSASTTLQELHGIVQEPEQVEKRERP